MDLGLKGKVAMVGGASRGLGFAVAEALAKRRRDRCRWRRATRQSIRDAARTTRRATASPALGTTVDVQQGRADRRRGRSRPSSGSAASICCSPTPAGRRPARCCRFDDAAWQNAIDLLLFSTLRMVRAVVPSMRERGGGAILVSTSSSVKEPIAEPRAVDRRARVGVGAGEDAVDRARRRTGSASTRSSPAASTPIASDSSTRSPARNRASRRNRRRRRRCATIPLGRYGEPPEFGRVAAFLLSDAAVLHDRRDRAGRRRADQEVCCERPGDATRRHH